MSDQSDFEAIPQARLNDLGKLATEARELQMELDRLNAIIAEKSERLRIVLEGDMPDIMMELGMEQIKLTTGEKLTMTKFYSAAISEEHRDAAFKWLRENGFDSLIKNKVEGSFGKGEDEKFQEVMKLLEHAVPGVFGSKTSVHPMTLKSFVKERIESGQEVPADIFSVHIGNKIKIK